MYQTIRVSSCVSVQGEFVEVLADGQMVIRVGEKEYLGQPVARGPGRHRAPPDLVAAIEVAQR